MILDKEIEILITPRNITYYRNLGYDDLKFNDKIMVIVENLPKFCKMTVNVKCEVCDNESELKYEKYVINKARCGFYSCKSCSNKKRIITSQEKWGVDNYQQTDECKERMEISNIEKYGVKTTLLCTETKEKIDKTNVERYGTKYVLSSTKIREKGKLTFMKKYNVEHFSQSDSFKDGMSKKWNEIIKEKIKKFNLIDPIVLDDNTIQAKCLKNHVFNIPHKLLYQRNTLYNVEICTICNPIGTGRSGAEMLIFEFIKNNCLYNVIESDKTVLDGKELDIYIPDLNLAFEYNGLYWHSDLIKTKNYHNDKTEACLIKGIQLIHIYEDEWVYKQDIVKSRILNLLGKTPVKIHARKCTIKEISSKELSDFCSINHIQGHVNGKTKIGLYHNNDLVSVMSFGSLRKNLGRISKDGQFELLRFCNKLNTVVVGGASKLFKYFINKYKPQHIISYADRSWSKGILYEQLGFVFVSNTVPNYWYVKNNNRYDRWNFRKDVLVKDGFDINKTEKEIMMDRGYSRIYNSGSMLFVWNS